MQKLRFTIQSNTPVARDTFRMRLSCPEMDPCRSGQFVDIALDGFFLRRPISVCDCGPGSLTLLYKTVGSGTMMLSRMQPGDTLELLCGLGHGFTPESCRAKALLAGGGIGAAPLYLLAKELLAAGRQVSVFLGFNRADEVLLREEFSTLGIRPHIATMDGSEGTKGFVTDAIREAKPEYDFFYTCGPMKMMQAVCGTLDCRGEASLEERMGCGAGFCYGCSCHTMVGAKRICKDGPVFKKEDIIW